MGSLAFLPIRFVPICFFFFLIGLNLTPPLLFLATQGPKCRFAHGASELRPVSRHPKYKTQPCKTFREQGHCPYGPRCLFIHEDPLEAQQSSSLAGSNVSPSALAGQMSSLSLGRTDEPEPHAAGNAKGRQQSRGNKGPRSHGSTPSGTKRTSRSSGQGPNSQTEIPDPTFENPPAVAASSTPFEYAPEQSNGRAKVTTATTATTSPSTTSVDEARQSGRGRLQFFQVISQERADAGEE